MEYPGSSRTICRSRRRFSPSVPIADDESFGLGAALRTWADQGTRVSVLSFTHGEASTSVPTAGICISSERMSWPWLRRAREKRCVFSSTQMVGSPKCRLTSIGRRPQCRGACRCESPAGIRRGLDYRALRSSAGHRDRQDGRRRHWRTGAWLDRSRSNSGTAQR